MTSYSAAKNRSCNMQAHHFNLTGGACSFEQVRCEVTSVFSDEAPQYYNYYITTEYTKICGGQSFPNVTNRADIQAWLQVDEIPMAGNSCRSGWGASPTTNRPINTATGNKYFHEVDFVGNGRFPLRFTRHFNSRPDRNTTSGARSYWSHSYSQEVVFWASGEIRYALVLHDDGSAYRFRDINNGVGWTPQYSRTPGQLETVEDAGGAILGWIYKLSEGVIERFDATGRLTSIQKDGVTHNLEYFGTTVTVTHENGSSLIMEYEDSPQYLGFGRIQSITDSSGNTYRYVREDDDWGDNLTKVVYPDATTEDDTDNPYRQYLYENVDFPTFVTGIIDENGNRVSTVAYDATGNAVSSEGANGVDRSYVEYEDFRSTVTNALGKQTIYNYQSIGNAKQITSVEGLPTATCAGANKNYTYDANGFLSSKTDWNGNVTTYVHDDRGLETTRTEGAGTPQARTITTEWHTDYRVPVRITEPDKITEFSYDTNGRLLNRREYGIQ